VDTETEPANARHGCRIANADPVAQQQCLPIPAHHDGKVSFRVVQGSIQIPLRSEPPLRFGSAAPRYRNAPAATANPSASNTWSQAGEFILA
jgi:hypothetical protein